jgi:AcrR family transcriptional regulator
MALYRRRGFGHTSMRDIEEATGLHPGSIYKAYGSKDALFVAALRAYNERIVRGRIATHLDGVPDPIAAIDRYFRSTFDGGERANPGCLLTTTATEARELDRAARGAVTEGLTDIEDALRRTLARAADQGRLPAGVPIDSLAAQLLALYQGLLVLVRFGAPRERLERAADGARALLGHVTSKGEDT